MLDCQASTSKTKKTTLSDPVYGETALHFITKESTRLNDASKLDLLEEILVEKGGNANIRNKEGKSVRMILTAKLPQALPDLKEEIETLLNKLENEKTAPELRVWKEQPFISALKQSRLKTAFVINLVGGHWETR